MKPSSSRRVAVGNLLLALGVFALGVFFFVGAFSIKVLPSYARIGPRFFPYLVAAGLLLCGLLLFMQALRGQRAQPQAEENVDADAPIAWRALLILAGALVVYSFIVEPLGFIVASSLLFFSVTLAFGSNRYLRDGVTGLLLSALVYLVFTRFLDLNLPAGILNFLFAGLVL